MNTNIKWDGVPRLHNWLATVLGKVNTPPLAKYGTVLLLDIAKQMQGKPFVQEKIIVFYGRQGLRKSTLLRALAGDHFSDDAIANDPTNVWLKEIAEIDLLGQTALTSLKRYLTNPEPQQGNTPVIVGTASSTTLALQRLCVVLHITRHPDIEWLTKHREQLLAEAAEKVGT